MIAVGFLMYDSVKTVAAKFPNTKFMIIDNGWSPGDPSNLEGTLFHEQEAGYLVGYLAGSSTPRQAGDDEHGRRPEDPAGRPLHRRLPRGRQGG